MNFSKIQFMTSGGGSMALKGIVPKWDPKELKFYHNGEGFMSVQITQIKGNCVKNCFGPKTKLDIAFYDVDGKVLYNWNKSK
ncbi:putative Acid phosphatase [Lupinus albus]|uniref:Putative Acid phosphatase n=1 Tax=Lupinus albus TaxID=3870 RepID=A0A6A4PHN7_LUPAL|nr:putative Acid phosphatase [Lupinus albus]